MQVCDPVIVNYVSISLLYLQRVKTNVETSCGPSTRSENGNESERYIEEVKKIEQKTTNIK